MMDLSRKKRSTPRAGSKPARNRPTPRELDGTGDEVLGAVLGIVDGDAEQRRDDQVAQRLVVRVLGLQRPGELEDVPLAHVVARPREHVAAAPPPRHEGVQRDLTADVPVVLPVLPDPLRRELLDVARVQDPCGPRVDQLRHPARSVVQSGLVELVVRIGGLGITAQVLPVAFAQPHVARLRV